MSKIVLISCVSKKLQHEAKARELYQSPLFKMSFEYASSLKPDRIFILSAKYGLLDPEKVIEPYNTTLNKMKPADICKWAKIVVEELNKVTDIQNDHFIFLAGERYRKYIIHHIKSREIPMDGLSIGKQLKFLKSRLG